MYVYDFVRFNEALRPSQFRKYIKNWNKDRYSEKFKELKEKYDGDRNAFRIYIPFSEDKTKSPNEDEITRFLGENGFMVEDYLGGVARMRGAKNTTKIGKALTMISKRPDTDEKVKKTALALLKKFGEDPVRKAGGNEFLICLSRHPYDIAGADTDRKWHNCMTIGTWDTKRLVELKKLKKTLTGKEREKVKEEIEKLEDGTNVSYIKHDVKQGSLVAYLIRKDDRNINDPVAVLNIKPFINQKDENDIILVEDVRVYGQDVPGFKEKVGKLMEEFNGTDRKGWFCINPKVYDDGHSGVLKGGLSAILSDEQLKKVNDFFDDLFNGLKEMSHPDYPDSILFYKEVEGEKVGWMEHDLKQGRLWCRWDGFWLFFINEIGLKHSETRHVVKTMVEQHLNREVGTPIPFKESVLKPVGWKNILIERQ